MSFEIDPVKYGQLWEKVDNLTAKVDKLEKGMEEVALAQAQYQEWLASQPTKEEQIAKLQSQVVMQPLEFAHQIACLQLPSWK